MNNVNENNLSTELNIEKYPLRMRFLHWVIAIVIFGLIGLGYYMAGLDEVDPKRRDIYDLHKSFGVVALILIALRVLLRFSVKIPSLPKTLSAGNRFVANSAYLILYILMIFIPVSGIVMSNMFGYNVKLFVYELPKIFQDNKELGGIFRELHEIMPYVLLGVVILHILGALKHHFFEKEKANDVLKRMM